MNPTQQRLIQNVGKTLPSQITRPGWQSKVTGYCEQFEKARSWRDVNVQQNPEAKAAEIRGSEPHYSRDDPPDNKEVISIRFTDANGKRIASAHVHEDGDGKIVPIPSATTLPSSTRSTSRQTCIPHLYLDDIS
ncbi:hypothetical protein DOTSEDRAFT_37062 [Dothistroma septosporum NZE10]|uniref:Uncharacterized protein n=1 Tax=Dothistroma septosporum (strain NZE10 / CBS 128990) TaxID=675120 RepID=N1PKC0_DOTSN|nr:hypothetical protein DOTSEDRAFT_37062 [Dothistroma septosporum NZE10]